MAAIGKLLDFFRKKIELWKEINDINKRYRETIKKRNNK